jgi:hypothetical protein
MLGCGHQVDAKLFVTTNILCLGLASISMECGHVTNNLHTWVSRWIFARKVDTTVPFVQLPGLGVLIGCRHACRDRAAAAVCRCLSQGQMEGTAAQRHGCEQPARAEAGCAPVPEASLLPARER